MDLFIPIAGVVVGIVATVVVSVLVTLKLARTKDPSWALRGVNVLRDHVAQVEGLEILYHSKPIESLTVSRLLFWNRGLEAIRNDDIAPDHPIQVACLGDIRMMARSILETNHDACHVTATEIEDERMFTLRFNHLNHGDGVVVQVIHTGTSPDSITVHGEVIGASVKRRDPKIFTVPVTVFGRAVGPSGRQGIAMAGVGVLVLSAFAALGPDAYAFIDAGRTGDVTGDLTILALVSVFAVGWFVQSWRRRVPQPCPSLPEEMRLKCPRPSRPALDGAS